MNNLHDVMIVSVNGSPHRDGNTATLMRWVLEGRQAAGTRVSWVHLVDYHIQYCEGCFTCLRTGKCSQLDSFAWIRNQLLKANGIVAGSPVYAGQPSAQMKTLIDRLALLNPYKATLWQHHLIGVLTSGVAPTGDVAKDLAMFFGKRVASSAQRPPG